MECSGESRSQCCDKVVSEENGYDRADGGCQYEPDAYWLAAGKCPICGGFLSTLLHNAVYCVRCRYWFWPNGQTDDRITLGAVEP